MDAKKELFEHKPVGKALATLAVPTIISQLITMIYNLADTFFIGLTDDPYKIASTTLCFVLVFAMNSLSNLFGVGGGTLISRLMGKNKTEDASEVASFSFYGSVAVAGLCSLGCFFFMPQILNALGASENTIGYSESYAFWVVVVGGIPATLSMTLSHLFRSEGYAKEASFGLGLGGVINIALDPLFMFVILSPGNEVAGAALATMLANCVSLLYFLITYFRLRKNSILSFDVGKALPGARYIKEVMATGVPSALGSGLACVSNMVLNNLSASHGDIELAALGIVKKIDMLPLNVGMGLCQGMLPLVAYNYASGNRERMKKVIGAARMAGVVFALICVATFQLLPGQIVSMFVREKETLALGTSFLRICCLAVPLMFYNILSSFSIQAMGKGPESLFLSVCRQGLVNIPLLILMNHLFGMTGVVWTQFLADSITMIFSTALFRHVLKKIEKEAEEKI